jgi:phosphoribosyl 1,2-cyclic phosphodiesterase
LKQCRVLVLEANHDEHMLLNGPYPWALKQRIRSRHGHLSNLEMRRLLEELCWSGLETLFLAHLSEENNCPELAGKVFKETFDAFGYETTIVVGRQAGPSHCFYADSAPTCSLLKTCSGETLEY